MKILALETSSTAGSVALLEDGRVVELAQLDPHLRTTQSFAPAILALMSGAAWRPRDVQLVAVTSGPGSFTGLRIGVMAAKVLAYALHAQLVAVNTLEVIARQSPGRHPSLWAVLDAQRQQLFAAQFCVRQSQDLETIQATAILDADQWLQQLETSTEVTGRGLIRLEARLPERVTVVDKQFWNPQASTVGRLALERYQSGHRDDLWKLAPQYFRKSAAEEKWEARRHE